MDQFDALLAQTIASTLGKRCTWYGYQYSEILRSLMYVYLFPDFVIAYPKKYKSYNFSRQECKKQGFSRIGGRACYFTRLFARLPKQQKQPLIIKHLQTYFEKVTKSGFFPIMDQFDALLAQTIASTLGKRCTWYGYQYSEILRSLMYVYLFVANVSRMWQPTSRGI